MTHCERALAQFSERYAKKLAKQTREQERRDNLENLKLKRLFDENERLRHEKENADKETNLRSKMEQLVEYNRRESARLSLYSHGSVFVPSSVNPSRQISAAATPRRSHAHEIYRPSAPNEACSESDLSGGEENLFANILKEFVTENDGKFSKSTFDERSPMLVHLMKDNKS